MDNRYGPNKAGAYRPNYEEFHPQQNPHVYDVSYDDGYDNGYDHGRSGGLRQAQTKNPWWNPRYWRKAVWITVVILILAVAIGVGVGVGVSQSKNNAYPDYTEVNYSLKDTIEGESFFDNFDYFTGYDPTFGFVHYVPRPQAEQLNLTYASSESAILRVDTSVGPGDEPDASTGRFSVRVTSKTTWDSGLFIFDVKHTPFGCATWPALWLSDHHNWPDNGEIDVMEAANQADNGNQMTLHTTDGCNMKSRRKQTGDTEKKDCNHAVNENAGCGVKDKDSSYGEAFNKNDGGIMAMEWRDAGIRMWQFARGSIPSDITDKKPNPATWGTARADFPNTNCDIGNHFKNQSIIVNINLCGQMVYGLWDESGCPSNCTDYVATRPEAFKNAYWEFGKFEVYQAS